MILRGFPIFDEALLDTFEFLDLGPMWGSWHLNALYEAILDKPAPGATDQAVKGHDHDPNVTDGQGGAPIGRAFCGGAGQGNNPLYTIVITTGDLNTWKVVSPLRNAAGKATLRAYIGPGIKSTGNPPAIAPYIDGEVFIYSVEDVQLRIRNVTLAVYSLEATHTKRSIGHYAKWTRITRIPCNGEGWDAFDLEVKASIETTIYVGRIQLSESPIVGAEVVALVPSLGSQTLG